MAESWFDKPTIFRKERRASISHPASADTKPVDRERGEINMVRL
jgi:hypothetical protein